MDVAVCGVHLGLSQRVSVNLVDEANGIHVIRMSAYLIRLRTYYRRAI